MTETPKEAKSVRDSLALEWSGTREDQLARGIVATYRRRRATKRAAAALAALVVVGAGYTLSRHSGQTSLPDGSTIARLDDATQLEITEQTADHVAVRLERGRARFAVTRDPKRTFKVHAGDVGVEVVGTVFEVDRQDGHTRVSVREGRVLVTRGGLTTLVGAGESRDVDTSGPPPPLEVEPPTVPPPPTVEPTPEKPKPQRSGPSMAEVLKQVDALRLDGKAKPAAELLEHALRDHPNDPLAAQAQFMLGRVLQDDRHEPARAAVVFEALRKRFPKSVLAEDAMARQVECLVATGGMDRARELVQLYDATYPRGAHNARLRKLTH